jgi:hypothetical protein
MRICVGGNARCDAENDDDQGHKREQTELYYNQLSFYTVVESKRNIIRKGLVHELLNAQDTVLCSYFAQRSGERDVSRSGDRNVEEAFQGLDSFI